MTKQIKMRIWPKENERKNAEEKHHADAKASSLVIVVWGNLSQGIMGIRRQDRVVHTNCG